MELKDIKHFKKGILPRITEVLKIEPYKLMLRWNTGEIRVIDFELVWKGKARSQDPILLLKDYETFKVVIVNDQKTLSFPLAQIDGQALSLCPDVLYEQSKPVSQYNLVAVSVLGGTNKTKK
jgi:hypothetical protein